MIATNNIAVNAEIIVDVVGKYPSNRNDVNDVDIVFTAWFNVTDECITVGFASFISRLTITLAEQVMSEVLLAYFGQTQCCRCIL